MSELSEAKESLLALQDAINRLLLAEEQFLIGKLDKATLREAGKHAYSDMRARVREIGDDFISTEWSKFEQCFSTSLEESYQCLRNIENRIHELLIELL